MDNKKIDNLFNINKPFVEIYVEEMKEMKNSIKELTKTKELFLENQENIRNLLYNLGNKFYCFRGNVEKYHRQNPNDYIYERHLYGNLSKLFVIPGGHDFNVCLNKYNFSYELFINFYNLWLDDIEVFIHSKAMLIPRFYHTISVIKGKIKIEKYIFIEKEDLGYNPPERLTYEKETNRNILSEEYKNYCKNWEFKNVNTSSYFLFEEKYPTKEEFTKLYKSYGYSEKELEEGFLKNKYPVYVYIEKNIDYFKNLKDINI